MNSEQRILIVDELDDRRKQLRLLLETHKCTVVEAANCEDALELLIQLDIHLVLTETELPTMSGLFLLQRVKTRHPETEVILLTNNASSFNLLQALRLGAYDFIVRPIDTGEILDKALERVFAHIGMRAENAQLVRELERQNNGLQHALKLLQAINTSMEQVAAATDVLDVFKALLTSAVQTISARSGFIALLDQRSGQLKLKAGCGISAGICRRYADGIPDGLTTELFRRGKPLLVSEKLPPKLFDLARNAELSDLLAGPGLLVAPLRFLKREVGVLVISGHRDESEFTEHELHFLIQIAHHACLVLEKTGEIYQLKKKIKKVPDTPAKPA